MQEELQRRMAARVRELRAMAGMTQEEVAAAVTALGIPLHSTAVTRIEKAGRAITATELVALASVFRVPLDSIATRDGLSEIDGAIDDLNGAYAMAQTAIRELVSCRDRLTALLETVELDDEDEQGMSGVQVTGRKLLEVFTPAELIADV